MTFEGALGALFQAPFDDASVTSIELVNGYAATFSELVYFAAAADAVVTTTQDLADRQTAADIFVTACMTACFAALCEAMAGKSVASGYRTADDVAIDLNHLADNWAVLANRSVAVDLRVQMSEIYTRTSSILQGLEVTLPSVAVLDVPSLPASVLSYWLYDTDSNIDTLIGLNADLPPWLYIGNANVLVTR